MTVLCLPLVVFRLLQITLMLSILRFCFDEVQLHGSLLLFYKVMILVAAGYGAIIVSGVMPYEFGLL